MHGQKVPHSEVGSFRFTAAPYPAPHILGAERQLGSTRRVEQFVQCNNNKERLTPSELHPQSGDKQLGVRVDSLSQ